MLRIPGYVAHQVQNPNDSPTFQGDVTGNMIPKPMSVYANMMYSDKFPYNYDLQMKTNYGDDYALEVKDVGLVEKNK